MALGELPELIIEPLYLSMNRIILVGNGFDLAHNLKTKYSDFLDYYWSLIIDGINQDARKPYSGYGVQTDRGFEYGELNAITFKEVYQCCLNENVNLKFSNKFLEIISSKNDIQKWVDVEEEYYNQLLKTIKNSEEYSIYNLNSDFLEIKNAFITYLKKEVPEIDGKELQKHTKIKIKPDIASHIFSNFSIKDFTESGLYILVDELTEAFMNYRSSVHKNDEFNDYHIFKSLKDHLNSIGNVNLNDKNEVFTSVMDLLDYKNRTEDFFEISPKNIYILNFNYTNTAQIYSNHHTEKFIKSDLNYVWPEINHIHGYLEDLKNNPVIFGFGDELDDNYSQIEKLKNNEYLENIKSIRYSDTDNYKKLLQFINSDNYQIFIFGHSCGVSDRTMLNTLFEHENCVSIKPYYHLKENGMDNYSDIVRNISRNFNNKASMRDKVVNKTYCQPLVSNPKN